MIAQCLYQSDPKNLASMGRQRLACQRAARKLQWGVQKERISETNEPVPLLIYIECGDCQRAVSRSCKNLLCAFDTAGTPVIVPVHDVEYLFSTTVDKSECRAILTKANFCELYKGWIDEHIRDPHACPLNDLYVNWEIPDPCAARIFLNR